MKKYYCKECLVEINPQNPMISPEDIMNEHLEQLKAEIVNFDKYPDYYKKSKFHQVASEHQCHLCKNRRSTEETIVFDSEDPMSSLKHIPTVNISHEYSGDDSLCWSYAPTFVVLNHQQSSGFTGIVFLIIGSVLCIAGLILTIVSINTDTFNAGFLALLTVGFIFALTGLFVMYFSHAKGHIRFYPNYLESIFGMKANFDKAIRFYRGPDMVVRYVFSGSNNTSSGVRTKVYKITINNKTVADGQHLWEAKALKKYLDLYLRPDNGNSLV